MPSVIINLAGCIAALLGIGRDSIFGQSHCTREQQREVLEKREVTFGWELTGHPSFFNKKKKKEHDLSFWG
jgi:hypothetical protein